MDNVALITGGTSGLGYALAKVFAEQGYNLLLIARHQEELERTAKNLKNLYSVDILTLANDLRNDNAAEDIYGFCRERGIQVEILANNAGTGTYGPFLDTYVDDNEATVQLDVVSLINLTYLFAHDMVERKRGFVLNVSSTAGFQPGPNMAVYYASKSFVLSFSESVATELKDSGVSVSCLCPGPMQTPMLERSGMLGSHIIRSFKPMDPDKVARMAYAGMMKRKVIIIPGAKNKRRAVACHFFPKAVIRYQMSLITRPLPAGEKHS